MMETSKSFLSCSGHHLGNKPAVGKQPAAQEHALARVAPPPGDGALGHSEETCRDRTGVFDGARLTSANDQNNSIL